MHGPESGVKKAQTDRQTNRQTGRGKVGGWKTGEEEEEEVLFPEDVSDCLASRVSALHWRNQVDRKGGSQWGQPEPVGLKRYVSVHTQLLFHARRGSADVLKFLPLSLLSGCVFPDSFDLGQGW